MSGYVTVNRLSLVQLYCEERKQQAHMKKIAEMQRRSGLDTTAPAYFPRVKHNFSRQMEKNRELARENDVKSKKILEIMQSKPKVIPSPFQPSPTNANRRRQPLNLSQNNLDYLNRISKVKGKYDAREWQKEFEEHQGHLKLSKDNKLFTPRDIGVNRQRLKVISTINSRRTTPTSSSALFTSNND